MNRAVYRQHKRAMQIQLVALQRHLIAHEQGLVIILEGRDAAGKDGAIKRITEHMSPRETRVVALGKPNERDRASWYFQRFVPYLPAKGEIVLFNRSWYNRAGVEHVMGFCTDTEYDAFFRDVTAFERLIAGSGTMLLKFYLDISRAEQARRLADRLTSPLTAWKSSPIDAVALENWDAYSRARNRMLAETGPADLPWRVVPADDKRVARLTVMAEILAAADCGHLDVPDPAQFGGRVHRGRAALEETGFLAP